MCFPNICARKNRAAVAKYTISYYEKLFLSQAVYIYIRMNYILFLFSLGKKKM